MVGPSPTLGLEDSQWLKYPITSGAYNKEEETGHGVEAKVSLLSNFSVLF